MAKKIQCLFVSTAKTTKRSRENMAGKETKPTEGEGAFN
jgi:hypothetical protein